MAKILATALSLQCSIVAHAHHSEQFIDFEYLFTNKSFTLVCNQLTKIYEENWKERACPKDIETKVVKLNTEVKKLN